MDEINDILSLATPIRRITLLGGVNNGRVVARRDFCEKKTETRPVLGTEYATKFVREQRNKNFEVNEN